MDIVNEIIENNSGLLTSLLIYSEFDFEQANRFLPHAAHDIIKAVAPEGVANVPSTGNHIPVVALLQLQKIDINRLATAAAIEPVLARKGLNVLLPKLLELLRSKGNGVAVGRDDEERLPGARRGACPKLFS